MDLCIWNCCRTCLSSETLYPIFPNPDHVDKYSNILLNATGLKVESTDSLPQAMCSNCITFVNECTKFRRRCEESHRTLMTRAGNLPFCEVKIEPLQIFKSEFEKSTELDISTFNEDDFHDFDDHIPLESLQYVNNLNNLVDKKNDVQTDEKTKCETGVEETKCEKSSEATVKEKRVENGRKPKKRLNSTKIQKGTKKRLKKEVKEQKEKETGEKKKEEIECEYCHKILTSKLSLRNHYKIHTGFDVVCEHCGKKFITKRLLLMHCRAKHGYEKTDKCSFCDYKASNAEQVKIHERLHTGERPYVCGECGAGFHRRSSHLQHLAIHLPDKTVQCDQCSARFKSVTLMRIHRNRHRAPQYCFRCVVCGNSFARRRNVVRHLQRIHGLTPDQQHIDRLKIT